MLRFLSGGLLLDRGSQGSWLAGRSFEVSTVRSGPSVRRGHRANGWTVGDHFSGGPGVCGTSPDPLVFCYDDRRPQEGISGKEGPAPSDSYFSAWLLSCVTVQRLPLCPPVCHGSDGVPFGRQRVGGPPPSCPASVALEDWEDSPVSFTSVR